MTITGQEQQARNEAHRAALRIALLYAAFAGLWILGSDWLVHTLFGNGERISLIQSFKGELFVLVTAVLLYLTFRRVFRRSVHNVELGYLAYHDDRTGLPNRLLFLDYLARSLRRAGKTGGTLAVVVIGLDALHRIRDSLGEEACDELVEEISDRLQSATRHNGVLARIGFDRAALIMEGLRSNASAVPAVEKLLRLMAEPYLVQGDFIEMPVTAGLSLFPAHGNQPDMLLQHAITAMQHVARSGTGRYRIYSTELTAAARRQLQLQTRLRKAIDEHELSLHFQPIVRLADGHLKGAEALVRWEHPEEGMLSPAEFIPLAEESGLIVPLGAEVVRMACAQLREWQNDSNGDFVLSVNVSGVELHGETFARHMEYMCRENGIPPARLQLEITETVAVQKPVQAVQVMRQLRHAGFQLAIDDFGTGYSSLGYLKQFPVQRIKLDRMFVADMLSDTYSSAITEAVLLLGKSLGISMLAEGVETEAQLRRLAELGYDEAQGYCLGRPMPAEEFRALLAGNRA